MKLTMHNLRCIIREQLETEMELPKNEWVLLQAGDPLRDAIQQQLFDAIKNTYLLASLSLFIAIFFGLIGGFLAAKFKTAERIILPFVNFMESVPLVGFMTLVLEVLIKVAPRYLQAWCTPVLKIYLDGTEMFQKEKP